MFMRARTEDGALVFYKEKWSTIFLSILMVAGFMAFGLFFLSIEKMPAFAQFMGYMFVAIGLVVAVIMIPYFLKIMREGGHVILRVTNEGLYLSPHVNGEPYFYSWDNFSSIVLAHKIKSLRGTEKGLSWRQALLFFKKNDVYQGVIERSKRQIMKTAQGQDFTQVSFPKQQEDMIVSMFDLLAPRQVKITSKKLVEFDYKNSVDRFQA